MSYLDWKVGDRVVCINDSGRRYEELGYIYPREGAIYTIREIIWVGYVCILLDEVSNRCAQVVGLGWREPGFNAAHFRKIQPRKTDISCFERLLRQAPAEEDA